uniref:General transcription factor IIH subunit 5 n=1 Tax=Homo sapiens TaxID=9606 RepID=A0A8I5KQH8_HUMAN
MVNVLKGVLIEWPHFPFCNIIGKHPV